MPVHGHPAGNAGTKSEARAGLSGDNPGRQRWELLHQIDGLLDGPMVVLSFVWLGLTIVDFTSGLGRTLNAVSYVIWALFTLQFLIGIAFPPSKLWLRRSVRKSLPSKPG